MDVIVTNHRTCLMCYGCIIKRRIGCYIYKSVRFKFLNVNISNTQQCKTFHWNKNIVGMWSDLLRSLEYLFHDKIVSRWKYWFSFYLYWQYNFFHWLVLKQNSVDIEAKRFNVYVTRFLSIWLKPPLLVRYR